VRAAVQPGDPSLAAERRFGDETVHPQATDIDIDIRQQRPFAGRRLQFRGAAQGHPLRGQRADVDVVVEIGERPPVHPHFGREQEFALLVAHRKAAQHHRAIERPLDPRDPDIQPAFERQLADLVGYEAAPRLRVEQVDADGQQGGKRQQRPADPLGDGERPVATAHHHDLGRTIFWRIDVGRAVRGGAVHGRLLAGHQNACPIET
jgi:hypothetical protein